VGPPMNKQKLLVVGALALVAFLALGVMNLRKSEHKVELKNIELQDRNAKLKQLEIKFNQLNQNLDVELKSKTLDQQKIKSLEDEKSQLEQEKAKLNDQLQAKAKQKQAAQLAAAKVQNVVVPAAYASDGSAKSFIYMSESGNVPCKINGGSVDCNYDGNRACGIGQALPCQKLTAVCALSNYACQDAWFTSYMQSRYGTWENARAFWLAHKWW
jgi:outer membrane murein-binding lipoprotein Lpp